MTCARKFLLGITAVLFTVFEAIIFYLIHIVRPDTELNLRYISIIGAVTFSWLTLLIEIITAKAENEKISTVIFNKTDGNLIRIAMIFTLIADYFLIAKSEVDNLTGVTVFLGTQLFIFLHIFVNDSNIKTRRANLITRVFLTVLLVALSYVILGKSADSLAIISVVYYANICTNAMFAHRIGSGGILLTVGLILFALCDINVGLSGLDSIYGGFPEGSLLYKIMNLDVDLIWLFYIPSQTLIPLTLLLTKNNKQKMEQLRASP